MKITETRKSIIELISPYMDKTLSNGIICNTQAYSRNNGNNISKNEYILTDYLFEQTGIYNYVNTLEETKHFSWVRYITKIIWHYDITALEKYIMSLWFVIITYSNHKEISNYWFNDWFWTFPNKPLHLYAEKEEESLLDLLLKLKTNDI